MADLKIAPARDSGNAPALILSLLILATVAAAIFYFNPHKVSELKVTNVDLYAPHTTFASLDGPPANGMHVLDAPTTSTENDLYVIAHVSLTDKLRLPLFITGATAHVKLADGSDLEANLLSASDLKRLAVIFPSLRQRVTNPMSDGDEISPGETRTGTVVLPFPGQTEDAWRNKKAGTLTIQLRNQGPQTTTLP